MDEAKDGVLSMQLTREELEAKLKETQERLERYRGSRAYNVQTAVDSEAHMIEDYLVTKRVTDYGLIGAAAAGIKEKAGEGIVETAADKGCNEPRDMAACLENGIIPNVMLPDGEDTYQLAMPYEDMKDATDVAENLNRIKRSLWAGIIPKEYEGIVESAEVRAGTAKTRINAIKGRMSGKRLILIKIHSGNPVKTG